MHVNLSSVAFYAFCLACAAPFCLCARSNGRWSLGAMALRGWQPLAALAAWGMWLIWHAAGASGWDGLGYAVAWYVTFHELLVCAVAYLGCLVGYLDGRLRHGRKPWVARSVWETIGGLGVAALVVAMPWLTLALLDVLGLVSGI